VFFFQAMMLMFSFYLGYLVKLCGGTVHIHTMHYSHCANGRSS
jgi:hypothetical protein